MILYLFFFFFLIILSSYKFERKQRIYLNIFCSIFVFIFSAFRQPNVDADYDSYVRLFNGEGASMFLEPTFQGIKFIVITFFNSDTFYLFFIYALLGIVPKLYFFKIESNLFLISLLIYFSHFFLLHDFTQIRVGAGLSIVFFSFKYLDRGNYFKYFLIILSASLFHYSLLFYLVGLLFNNKPINYFKYLSILIIVYCFYFLNLSFASVFSSLKIPFLDYKISSNEIQYLTTLEEPVNVFNLLQLIRIVIFFTFCYFAKNISIIKPDIYILLKIYFISIITFVLFSDNGLYSFRISQMFQVAEILFIPYILYLNRPIAKPFIYAYSILLSYYSIYQMGLISKL
jgi:hypothetical protein